MESREKCKTSEEFKDKGFWERYLNKDIDKKTNIFKFTFLFLYRTFRWALRVAAAVVYTLKQRFESFLEMTTVFFCSWLIKIRIHKAILTWDLELDKDQLSSDPDRLFSIMDSIYTLSEQEKLAYSFFIMLLFLGLINYMKFYSKVNNVINTIYFCFGDLLFFTFLFCLLISGQAITGMVLFGRQSQWYSSFMKAFLKFFMISLGKFDMKLLETQGKSAITYVYIVVVLLFFVLIIPKLFLMIVDSAYTDLLSKGKKNEPADQDPSFTFMFQATIEQTMEDMEKAKNFVVDFLNKLQNLSRRKRRMKRYRILIWTAKKLEIILKYLFSRLVILLSFLKHEEDDILPVHIGEETVVDFRKKEKRPSLDGIEKRSKSVEPRTKQKKPISIDFPDGQAQSPIAKKGKKEMMEIEEIPQELETESKSIKNISIEPKPRRSAPGAHSTKKKKRTHIERFIQKKEDKSDPKARMSVLPAFKNHFKEIPQLQMDPITNEIKVELSKQSLEKKLKRLANDLDHYSDTHVEKKTKMEIRESNYFLSTWVKEIDEFLKESVPPLSIHKINPKIIDDKLIHTLISSVYFNCEKIAIFSQELDKLFRENSFLQHYSELFQVIIEKGNTLSKKRSNKDFLVHFEENIGMLCLLEKFLEVSKKTEEDNIGDLAKEIQEALVYLPNNQLYQLALRPKVSRVVNGFWKEMSNSKKKKILVDEKFPKHILFFLVFSLDLNAEMLISIGWKNKVNLKDFFVVLDEPWMKVSTDDAKKAAKLVMGLDKKLLEFLKKVYDNKEKQVDYLLNKSKVHFSPKLIVWFSLDDSERGVVSISSPSKKEGFLFVFHSFLFFLTCLLCLDNQRALLHETVSVSEHMLDYVKFHKAIFQQQREQVQRLIISMSKHKMELSRKEEWELTRNIQEEEKESKVKYLDYLKEIKKALDESNKIHEIQKRKGAFKKGVSSALQRSSVQGVFGL